MDNCEKCGEAAQVFTEDGESFCVECAAEVIDHLRAEVGRAVADAGDIGVRLDRLGSENARLVGRVHALETAFATFLDGFDCEQLDGCYAAHDEEERCSVCNARWALFATTNPDGTIADHAGRKD